MPRLTLVLLLLAACAPAPPESIPAPEPATSAAPAPAAAMPAAGITGEYTTTLAAADIPASVPDSIRSGMIGTWVIAFHEGGHLVVNYNGRQVLEGPYSVEGNRISFSTGETGPYACNIPAAYTWQLSGGQLTFTRVADLCQGRIVVLTTRPLARR